MDDVGSQKEDELILRKACVTERSGKHDPTDVWKGSVAGGWTGGPEHRLIVARSVAVTVRHPPPADHRLGVGLAAVTAHTQPPLGHSSKTRCAVTLRLDTRLPCVCF